MKHLILFLLVTCKTLAQVEDDPVDLKTALSEALYTEEVTRDPKTAAEQYAVIVNTHRAQRKHVATALFRLADIQRTQGNTDKAISLYKEFATQFSDLTDQHALALQHLSKLGASIESSTAVASNANTELNRLKGYLTTAPDRLKSHEEFSKAVESNNIAAVTFLLINGAEKTVAFDGFQKAVKLGFLEIVKQIISHHETIPDETAKRALITAFDHKQSNILDYLIEQNFPLQSDTLDYSLLAIAAYNGRDQLVDQLLAKGANPNWTTTDNANINRFPKGTFISPLHAAITKGHFDIAVTLLNHGAKANLTTSANGFRQLKPIHLASMHGEDSEALLTLLIEKGADPNAKVNRNQLPASSDRLSEYSFLTPLSIAIGFKKTATVKTLLKYGAKPDNKHLLIARDHSEITRVLVNHGCNPMASHQGETLLYSILQHTNIDEDSINSLKDAGASLTIQQMNKLFNVYSRDSRSEGHNYVTSLYESFVIPTLPNPETITFFNTTTKATASVEPSPQSAFALLYHIPKKLKQQPNAKKPKKRIIVGGNQSPRKSYRRRHPSANLYIPRFTLLRQGKKTEHNILTLPTDFTLQKNDLVFLTSKESLEKDRHWEPDTTFALLKNISFPITVTNQDGKKESYTVRGDSLTFDYNKKILPYADHIVLAEGLTLGPKSIDELESLPSITRPNGSKFLVDLENTESYPREGDHIELRSPRQIDWDHYKYRSRTRIYSPNTAFRREVFTENNSPPTLFEALASCFYQSSLDTDLLKTPETLFHEAHTYHSPLGLAHLQHLDFTQITLRHSNSARPTTNGGMRRIWQTKRINLLEIINELGPNPTAHDIFEKDVFLERNTLIEIPTLTPTSKETSDLYSQSVSRFLQTAFSGTVTVVSPDKSISSHSYKWVAPTLKDTPFGRLPFAPQADSASHTSDGAFYSTLGEKMLRREFLLRRGDSPRRLSEHDNILLRDGDQLELSKE